MPARAQGVVTVYMYVSKTVTGFAKALALLTALLALTMDRTGLPLPADSDGLRWL